MENTENIVIKKFRKSCPSKTEKTRTRPYITAICGVCKKEFIISKAAFSKTKPCKSCQKRLRGKRNFLEKAKLKFGTKFDLTKAESEYVDYTTPVTIKCNKHNYEYKIKPVHFVGNAYPNAPHKGGCPKCASDASKKWLNKPISHYLAHLNSKFPDIKVSELPIDTSSNLNKIELICPIHGTFTKTLADLVKLHPETSCLCPKCSQELLAWNIRSARTDIPGTVYFVKFTKDNLYKCGVTYKDVNARLRGKLSQIETIWTVKLPTLEQAYTLETALFRKYSPYRTCYPDTSFGGYTEFLTINITKPDERFIEEILCQKESNSWELSASKVGDNPERSTNTN